MAKDPKPGKGATPGPWTWDRGDAGNDYSRPYCTVSADDGNLVIAQVNGKCSVEIGVANARLIAKAYLIPELVEALDRAAVALDMAAEKLETYRDEDSGLLRYDAKAARTVLARVGEE